MRGFVLGILLSSAVAAFGFDLHLEDGKVLKNCRIMLHSARGAKVMHSAGIRLLEWNEPTNRPPEWVEIAKSYEDKARVKAEEEAQREREWAERYQADLVEKEKQQKENTAFASKLKDSIHGSIPNSIGLTAVEVNGDTCVIVYSVGDNFTEGLVEFGWWRDSWKLIKAAFAGWPKCQNVQIVGRRVGVDAFGKSRMEVVGVVVIRAATFAKIDQQHFSPENLKVITEATFKRF